MWLQWKFLDSLFVRGLYYFSEALQHLKSNFETHNVLGTKGIKVMSTLLKTDALLNTFATQVGPLDVTC